MMRYFSRNKIPRPLRRAYFINCRGILLRAAAVFILSIMLCGCGKTGGPLIGPLGQHAGSPSAQPTPIQHGDLRLDHPYDGMTFISRDQIELAAANLADYPAIRWTIIGNKSYDGYSWEPTGEPWQIMFGEHNLFIPSPMNAPEGRGYRLGYSIYLEAFIYGWTGAWISIHLAQDEIDQCRQEYVDIRRNSLPIDFDPPVRDSFSDTISSSRFLHGALRISSDYNFIAYNQLTLHGLDAVQDKISETYIVQLDVTSYYRNPRSNERLAAKGSVLNSAHLWGIAVDFDVPDFNGNGEYQDEEDWEIMLNAALNTGIYFYENPIHSDGSIHYDYIHIQWIILPTQGD